MNKSIVKQYLSSIFVNDENITLINLEWSLRLSQLYLNLQSAINNITLLTSNICITLTLGKYYLKNEKNSIILSWLYVWGPLNLNSQCRPREIVVFRTTHFENDNRAKFWIIFPYIFHNFWNVLFIVLIVLRSLYTKRFNFIL